MPTDEQRSIIGKTGDTWLFTAGKFKGQEVMREGNHTLTDYWLWARRAGAVPSSLVYQHPELRAWDAACDLEAIRRRPAASRRGGPNDWQDGWEIGSSDPTEAGSHIGGFGWGDE